jgi:hypothetical protein
VENSSEYRSKNIIKYRIDLGTRWLGGLRNCATIRKAADAIPDAVIGIFHLHNPSGPGIDPVFKRNEYQEYLLGGNAADTWG